MSTVSIHAGSTCHFHLQCAFIYSFLHHMHVHSLVHLPRSHSMSMCPFSFTFLSGHKFNHFPLVFVVVVVFVLFYFQLRLEGPVLLPAEPSCQLQDLSFLKAKTAIMTPQANTMFVLQIRSCRIGASWAWWHKLAIPTFENQASNWFSFFLSFTLLLFWGACHPSLN